ncbi:MAG: hypothetical protein LBD07_02440 [Spirochaetaceae bacterium]|jgi:rubredoxin|nr:hypothetical protein [Spirochaetaceae bacterium]
MNSQNAETGLFDIYCPDCEMVTQKASFALLRQAGEVRVNCPACGGYSLVKWNGAAAEIDFVTGRR